MPHVDNNSYKVIQYKSNYYIVYENASQFIVLRALESNDEGLYCDSTQELYIKD